jgi:hypothetical protein
MGRIAPENQTLRHDRVEKRKINHFHCTKRHTRLNVPYQTADTVQFANNFIDMFIP